MTSKKLAVATTVFLFLFLIASASASITVGPNGLSLGYGNGSYSVVNPGTYSSLNRTDNIWYLDGKALLLPSNYEVLISRIFGNLYTAVTLLSVMPIVLIMVLVIGILRSELEGRKLLLAVTGLIGLVVWVAVGIFILVNLEIIFS